ncbi:MAG: hypothetical protein MZV64_44900 [Ignavibacteriales bacterium]|nr:hypothetical protein [Ignavibacteriales bacterium]
MKALELNPNGIDPNYFYAEFLYEEGKYARRCKYLDKAAKAAPRPGRESAGQGSPRRDQRADREGQGEDGLRSARPRRTALPVALVAPAPQTLRPGSALRLRSAASLRAARTRAARTRAAVAARRSARRNRRLCFPFAMGAVDRL